MAEPPGAQPALAIDGVEWLAMADNVLTVVVTGRWRRRASWRGRPVLVVEAHGRHHRFRAIPDPPSVAGATPGTWRMSFSVPADLAPSLGGHAWLQLGAIVVPLPGVVGPGARAPEAAGEPGGEPAAEPPAESWRAPEPSPAVEPTAEAEPPEPASEAEQPQQPAAEADPGRVGAEPTLRAESVIAAAADLSQRIEQLERDRRAAEQRAHQEHARWLGLEERQATLYPQLARAQARIGELEHQLTEARQSPLRPELSTEIAIARGVVRATARPPALDTSAAELARAQLDRERAMVALAETDRTAEVERGLRDHMRRAEQLYEVIDELRAVIDGIRGVDDSELGDAAGEPGSSGVQAVRLDAALARLRETIPAFEDTSAPESGRASEVTLASESGRASGLDQEASTSGATDSAADASSAVEPGDEAVVAPQPGLPPAEAAPVAKPTRKSWLRKSLRRLAAEDPAAAGSVILGLLPAGRLAYTDPLAYDLVLSDAGCIQVTARGAAMWVSQAPVARELADVDFRVTGELATLSRLLLAGRVRRRVGRRMARVKGRRKSLTALTSLVRTPLGLAELDAAGMRLDPKLAFRLVAVTIDPKAAAPHRFTIAHRGPGGSVYLRISGRKRPDVTDDPPLGPVATTIVSEPGALLGVLAGEDRPGVLIRGAGEPLELVRSWLQNANSD